MAQVHVTLTDTQKTRTVETRSTSKQGAHDTADNQVSRVITDLEQDFPEFEAAMGELTDDQLATLIDGLINGRRETIGGGRFALQSHTTA